MASYTTTSNGYLTPGVNNITTLIWGTDGLLQVPAPGGSYAGTGFYIVESVDEETDSETIYGENGTGQKAWRVIIKSGARWTISVQDDTGMAPPNVGTQVQVIDGAAIVGNAGLVWHATVVASGERFTRKGAAMRNITVEKLTLVD